MSEGLHEVVELFSHSGPPAVILADKGPYRDALAFKFHSWELPKFQLFGSRFFINSQVVRVNVIPCYTLHTENLVSPTPSFARAMKHWPT